MGTIFILLFLCIMCKHHMEKIMYKQELALKHDVLIQFSTDIAFSKLIHRQWPSWLQRYANAERGQVPKGFEFPFVFYV